jgi:hypothetical protein
MGNKVTAAAACHADEHVGHYLLTSIQPRFRWKKKKSVVDVISPDNFNSALDLVMEKMGGFFFFFLFFCLSEFNADVKCEKIFRHVYHILSFYFLILLLFDCVDSIIESVPPTRKSSSSGRKKKKSLL